MIRTILYSILAMAVLIGTITSIYYPSQSVQSQDAFCPPTFAPVCGVDGVTYGNECEANVANVVIAHIGPCQDQCNADTDCDIGSICIDGLCEPLFCTLEYDPVCGVDGVTYGNACQARSAHVDIAHEGECRECSSNADCSGEDVCLEGICQEPCEILCLVPDPVCGEDGNTYFCGKPDAACHGVEVAHEGECREPEPPSVCGNGILEGTEQCDDLNLPTATCDINCMTILFSCGPGTTPNGITNECDPDVTQAQLDQALAAVPNALAQRDAILATLFEFLRVFGVI